MSRQDLIEKYEGRLFAFQNERARIHNEGKPPSSEMMLEIFILIELVRDLKND